MAYEIYCIKEDFGINLAEPKSKNDLEIWGQSHQILFNMSHSFIHAILVKFHSSFVETYSAVMAQRLKTCFTFNLTEHDIYHAHKC